MTDFLEEPQAHPIPGLAEALTNGFNAQVEVLADIRRELMKSHPDVLAISRLQGSKIENGNNSSHKVYFELGGKPVTVYQIIAWTNDNTPVALSVNSMRAKDDGITLGTTPLVLNIAVDSVDIITDGSDDLFLNQPDATEDTVWIYGFTIPDYDRRRDLPMNYNNASEARS